ncbi:hypothetical protein GCM10027280_59980 [Micromonospora polyrhachis]|uniref:Uncharacterized protein n=1 Tax=Micromonospora polyrhachis TaxID=1282883 RepID=A0A7W7WNR0_9ACTN|nr:hypothetical protein [Micromonospora polyrhachis]MBB4957902.1 hypothetical protein [Micromonospora polyrhachis]
MRYRRRGQRQEPKERPFARRLKYEGAKEGLGKLAEWGGAALGMLLGVAATRLGVPLNPSMAATGGAILGGLLGSSGKAFVAAGMDHLRERREQRAAAGSQDSQVGGAGGRGCRRGSGSNGRTRTPRVAHFWSGPIGEAGQVISGIGDVIQQIERAHEALGGVSEAMRGTHDRVMMMLSGGRSEVVQQTHARLTSARTHVEDSLTLLRLANEDLRGYLMSI